MGKTLVYSLLSLLALSQTYALPQVKLGKTTILGRDLPEKVEFFGGEIQLLHSAQLVGLVFFRDSVRGASSWATQAKPHRPENTSGRGHLQREFLWEVLYPASTYIIVWNDVQHDSNTEKRADLTTTSEDCLSINVFRPAGVSSKEKLPVVSEILCTFVSWRLTTGRIPGTALLDLRRCLRLWFLQPMEWLQPCHTQSCKSEWTSSRSKPL